MEMQIRNRIAAELEAEATAHELVEVGGPPRCYATGVYRRAAQLVRDGAPRYGQQLQADVAVILGVDPAEVAPR